MGKGETEILEQSPLINWTIFQELLMMDEDEEGFAQSLVQTFVEQADTIFKDIDNILNANIANLPTSSGTNPEEQSQQSSESQESQLTSTTTQADSEDPLKKLSSLGHYLKGSAAALGLHKVQEECERIQNYGNKIPFDDYAPAQNAQTDQDWFNCIYEALNNAKIYYGESRKLLAEFFGAEI
ncbi:hypothetical protein BVG19_g4232 [[Candida] boidinii]|nr:hypothetical protein BVG19_g4232 [[Candida] boidinii]OWB53361.1 hypothetical protein B5S27_g4956 [[Candida] boidinii]